MSVQSVPVSVSQSVYDLGQKLAAIVVAIKSLPAGSSAIADVIAVAGPLLADLPAVIADVQALPADEKANLQAMLNGAYLAGVAVVSAAL